MRRCGASLASETPLDLLTLFANGDAVLRAP